MSALNLRTSARTSIFRVWSQIQADHYEPDGVEGKQLLSNARQHFARFMDNHLALVSAAQDDEIVNHDELLASTEEVFNKICIKLKRKMLPLAGSSTHSYSHAPDMRLDPVSIPSFDGQHENWLMFKDMFETLVHNRRDLDPTYKLGKLRQYVKAENVPLIGGLYTGGYEELWAELKRRYDNPRTLSETHVRRLLDLPNQPLESRAELTNIVDCVRNSFRALEVMNVPVKHWDAIAVPLLLPKLPVVTRTEWGMSLKSNDIPKIDDLMAFVERRAWNLPQSVSVNTSSAATRSIPRTARAHLSTASARTSNLPAGQGKFIKCPSCSDVHRITKCHKFRNLSVDRRWELVKQASLCFNCLKSGHSSRDCPSGVCMSCQQKHNTLLCRSSQQAAYSNTSPTNTTLSSNTMEPGVLPRHQ